MNTVFEDRMDRTHVPNTPRTHDAQGRKVDDPLQCQGCLQSWPCDVRKLLDRIDDLREKLRVRTS